MLSLDAPAPTEASWVLIPVGVVDPETSGRGSRRGKTVPEWGVSRMAVE